MDALPNNSILMFKNDTLFNIRKLYDLHKAGAMDQAIDRFEEWIKKQKHFTFRDFDRAYLERFLISSKGSLEKAKERLDNMCTFRTLIPKFFLNYDIKTDFQNIQGIIIPAILPEMTEDYQRVYICKVKGKHFSSKLLLEAYRHSCVKMEYVRAYDYVRSYHVVLDLSEASIAQILTCVDLTDLRELVTTLIQGYGVKVTGIYILSESKFMDTVVTITKSCVSEKLSKRVHSFKAVDELHDYMPKNVLPKDYGGYSDKTLQEMSSAWMQALGTDEFTNHWTKISEARTDESLRSKDKFNEEYMGMPGSFRVLSVD